MGMGGSGCEEYHGNVGRKLIEKGHLWEKKRCGGGGERNRDNVLC
jgi:hypothetical protein